MNALFIAISGIIGLASPVMCFLNSRRNVLYSFCLLTVISPIIWGYMDVTGLLGLAGGKLWSVLDIQWLLLIVFAYSMSRKNILGRGPSGVDYTILLMTCLIVLNFIVGYIRRGGLSGVLNIFRQFMSLPVYFAASTILAKPENVKRFYRLILWFVVFIFILHIAIAFQLYYPPLSSSGIEKAEATYYRDLLRSSIYIYEPFYIIAAAVAICSITYVKEKRILAFMALGCSGFGCLLTQARGMYGGMFLLVLGFMGLAKGKLKGMVIILISGVMFLGVFKIIQSQGIDLLYRFRKETSSSMEQQGYFDTVRGREFRNIIEATAKTPGALFTGHGFGAVSGGSETRTRGYFHNDYLGALFSLGLIGFGCYCFNMFSSIMRGRVYCQDPELAYMIMPARLTFFALSGYAFLNQTIWLFKGTAIVMAMLAISRNSSFYAEQIFMEREYHSEEELTYCDSEQFDDTEY